MFDTIEQGLEIYHKNIKEYIEWSSKVNPLIDNTYSLSDGTLHEYVERSGIIKGMEQSLGLSKDEIRRIIQEYPVIWRR